MEDQSKALTVFSFEEQEIRTVMIDGEPWFVAADVCKILEHSNVRVAVSRLDEDEKGVTNVYTPGGFQEMLCVNESGLYHLIFTSRKSEAKAFRRKVTNEILPALRKTGFYDPQGQIAAMQEEILQLRAREQLLLPERVTDKQAVEVLGELRTMIHEEQLAQEMDEDKRHNLEFALKKAEGYFKGLKVQTFNLKDKPNQWGEVRIKEYPDETEEDREYRLNQRRRLREKQKIRDEKQIEQLIIEHLEMYTLATTDELLDATDAIPDVFTRVLRNLTRAKLVIETRKGKTSWYELPKQGEA